MLERDRRYLNLQQTNMQGVHQEETGPLCNSFCISSIQIAIAMKETCFSEYFQLLHTCTLPIQAGIPLPVVSPAAAKAATASFSYQ